MQDLPIIASVYCSVDLSHNHFGLDGARAIATLLVVSTMQFHRFEKKILYILVALAGFTNIDQIGHFIYTYTRGRAKRSADYRASFAVARSRTTDYFAPKQRPRRCTGGRSWF